MRLFSEKSNKHPLQFAGELLAVIALLTVIGVVLVPFLASSGPREHPRSCLSSVKHLSISVVMYESDNNEAMPPYFTFDGAEQTQKFIDVTLPYTRKKELYLCPSDNEGNRDGPEGLAGKISYVHCLSLKGVIPRFSEGNRLFLVSEINSNSGTTPFLRDPIRGFGTTNMKGGETSNPAFLSPHGAWFNIAYLDAHVKGKKPIDEFTEL